MDLRGGGELKGPKALIYSLAIALAVVSVLALASYQHYVELRRDFEGLRESYAQLRDSYSSLQHNYEGLSANFEALSKDYSNLSERYTVLSAQYAKVSESFEALVSRYEELLNRYSSLANAYEELNKSYRSLSSSYSSLTASYGELQREYFELSEEHRQLLSNYTSLKANYTILKGAYEDLKSKYDVLFRLWNEPLEEVRVPTIDELVEWVRADKTNEHLYDPEKFTCGDFTIMLIQHAKERGWRMLFTVIEFDYQWENPSGERRHHGYHAHAFASIFTTKGIVYVEPQTDLVFYVHPPDQPELHVEIREWTYLNATQWLGGVVFVQYYNRMGALAEQALQSTSSSMLQVTILNSRQG
jgi:predicted nuclease with TOPRIM domain